jgi:hypothetical protein
MLGGKLVVDHETQRNWTDKLRQERQAGAVGSAAGISADERAELLRLRRQVGVLGPRAGRVR